MGAIMNKSTLSTSMKCYRTFSYDKASFCRKVIPLASAMILVSTSQSTPQISQNFQIEDATVHLRWGELRT